MGQWDGVVGGGFGEGEVALHLPGQADGAQEGDEAGQAAERGEMALGVSARTGLAPPKSEVISVRVVWCGAGPGCSSINPHALSPFRKATLFLFRSSSLVIHHHAEKEKSRNLSSGFN